MGKERDEMDAILTALRHPLRQRILKHLSGSARTDGSPKEMAAELEQPLSNVSYHVRVLVECRALTLVRTKPVRGSVQHFYKPSEQFLAEPGVAAILGLAK